MNWEQLGAIGELVSGIAVLVTLIYLALQIKQAKNLMLSNAHQARTDRNIALTQLIANDEQALKRTTGSLVLDELSEEELQRATLGLSAVLRHFEDMQYQHELNLVDDETWEANLRGIQTIFNQGVSLELWQRNRHMFRRQFAELVDSQIQKDQEL